MIRLWQILLRLHMNFIRLNLSNPKPGHTTGGSGRGARGFGQAGSGKIGCQQNYHSPRKPKVNVLSKKRRNVASRSPQKHEQAKSYFKTTKEQNHRLTRGLSPVYPLSISGTRSAFCFCLPTSGTTPFCFLNPFHARHVREKTRCRPTKISTSSNSFPTRFATNATNLNLSNPKPRRTTGPSCRGGTQRGGGVRTALVERDAIGAMLPRNNPSHCSPVNLEQCISQLFGNPNSLIPISNRRRNKTRR